MGATQFDKLWLENPSLSLKVNHTDFCYDVAINVNRPMNLKINYEYNDQLLVHDLPQNVPWNFSPDSHGFGTCITKLELLDSLQEMELNTNFVSHYITS